MPKCHGAVRWVFDEVTLAQLRFMTARTGHPGHQFPAARFPYFNGVDNSFVGRTRDVGIRSDPSPSIHGQSNLAVTAPSCGDANNTTISSMRFHTSATPRRQPSPLSAEQRRHAQSSLVPLVAGSTGSAASSSSAGGLGCGHEIASDSRCIKFWNPLSRSGSAEKPTSGLSLFANVVCIPDDPKDPDPTEHGKHAVPRARAGRPLAARAHTHAQMEYGWQGGATLIVPRFALRGGEPDARGGDPDGRPAPPRPARPIAQTRQTVSSRGAAAHARIDGNSETTRV